MRLEMKVMVPKGGLEPLELSHTPLKRARRREDLERRAGF